MIYELTAQQFSDFNEDFNAFGYVEEVQVNGLPVDKYFVDLKQLYHIGFTALEESVQNLTGLDLVDLFPIPQALIFDFIEAPQNPYTVDFSILGLVKESPLYDRGLKVKARYLHPSTSEVVVQKTFNYIYGVRTRIVGLNAQGPITVDIPNSLLKIDCIFEWLDSSGNVVFSKVETIKSFTIEEEENNKYNARKKSINWLKGRSKGTLIQNAVTLLFTRYSTALQTWYEEGTAELGNLISSENDTSIIVTTLDLSAMEVALGKVAGSGLSFVEILNFPLPNIDGTYTLVKNDILYQIGHNATIIIHTAQELGI
jgi:hypothetical protein